MLCMQLEFDLKDTDGRARGAGERNLSTSEGCGVCACCMSLCKQLRFELVHVTDCLQQGLN